MFIVVGYIALESEGSPVDFRNLRIRELPSSNPRPEDVAPPSQGFRPLYNGVDFDSRGKLMDECITIIRAALSGDYVEHHSEYYDFGRLKLSPARVSKVRKNSSESGPFTTGTTAPSVDSG